MQYVYNKQICTYLKVCNLISHNARKRKQNVENDDDINLVCDGVSGSSSKKKSEICRTHTAWSVDLQRTACFAAALNPYPLRRYAGVHSKGSQTTHPTTRLYSFHTTALPPGYRPVYIQIYIQPTE